MDHAPVRFQTVTISDTITRPSNTTAYAAGDAISTVTTDEPFIIPISQSYTTKPGPTTGCIDTAILISTVGSISPDFEVHLFSNLITETADNAAWSLSDAEALTYIGTIKFDGVDWIDGTACSIQSKHNLGLAFSVTSQGSGDPTDTTARQIVGQLVTRSAYTPASAEQFTLKLTLSLD